MLERRLHLVVQPQSHEEKCCFCPGRGCRPLSSQGYLRVSGSTTMCFMDLGKVFKNVSLNSVGGVSEVSPLWILYQSIILNKCQTSPLFCFLTSSANSIVIAIVNIQTGSIDWTVRSLVQLQATQEAFWVLGRCLCISVMRLQINCCPIIATTAVSRVQPCTGCKQTWHTEADRERERGEAE